MIIAIFPSGMDSIVYIQQSSGLEPGTPGASTTVPMTLRLLHAMRIAMTAHLICKAPSREAEHSSAVQL